MHLVFQSLNIIIKEIINYKLFIALLIVMLKNGRYLNIIPVHNFRSELNKTQGRRRDYGQVCRY